LIYLVFIVLCIRSVLLTPSNVDVFGV
jgi:hypothetical protein